MQKETLSLSNIRQDLKVFANSEISNVGEWRFCYIIPLTILSVMIGVLGKILWLALLIFLFDAYHIVGYIIEYKNYKTNKKAIMNAISRARISISIEQLTCISEETIYEPHMTLARARSLKTVKFYHFASGRKWRIPDINKHYNWSKEYYISSQGLENISMQGDEFLYISLQDNHDIAYIYPCKNFVLDTNLRDNNQF